MSCHCAAMPGDQVVLLHQRVAPVEVRLDQVVAIREVSHAAHVRELAVALQHGLDSRVAQIGVRDDGVGEPGPVRGLLQPLGLLDRIGRADGCLDVHGLRHVRVARHCDEVLGQPVALGQFPGLRSEDGVIFVRLPVGVEELGVTHVVEVDVSVDEFRLLHGRLLLHAHPACSRSEKRRGGFQTRPYSYAGRSGHTGSWKPRGTEGRSQRGLRF